jgi:hypothetical protein
MNVYQLAMLTIGTFKATYPKDHIYELLGLMDPEEKGDLEADYNKSVGEIFSDIMRRALSARHEIDRFWPLPFHAAMVSSDAAIDKPSWTINFAAEHKLSLPSPPFCQLNIFSATRGEK